MVAKFLMTINFFFTKIPIISTLSIRLSSSNEPDFPLSFLIIGEMKTRKKARFAVSFPQKMHMFIDESI